MGVEYISTWRTVDAVYLGIKYLVLIIIKYFNVGYCIRRKPVIYAGRLVLLG